MKRAGNPLVRHLFTLCTRELKHDEYFTGVNLFKLPWDDRVHRVCYPVGSQEYRIAEEILIGQSRPAKIVGEHYPARYKKGRRHTGTRRTTRPKKLDINKGAKPPGLNIKRD